MQHRFSFVHVQVCFKPYLFNIVFPYYRAGWRQSQRKRIRASGWFVQMEITTVHPIRTIRLKNILRTFEAEILKIQPKN